MLQRHEVEGSPLFSESRDGNFMTAAQKVAWQISSAGHTTFVSAKFYRTLKA